MTLRTIGNPTRGCGHLKKGGFYLRSDFGPGGFLAAWAWALGEGVIGGMNLNIVAPARQMQMIDLPATLFTRRLATDKSVLQGNMVPSLQRLPQQAIIDHIGEASYTPLSFAHEVMKYGPSRRIPQAVAAQLVRQKLLPIPVLFTHPRMPLVDASERDALFRWSLDKGDRPDYQHYNPVEYGVSCYKDDWGITAKDASGSDLWMIYLLKKLNRADPKGNKHLTKIMPSHLAENVLFTEQAVGVSWLTRAIYVADESDSTTKIDAIWSMGIEPVIAEPE